MRTRILTLNLLMTIIGSLVAQDPVPATVPNATDAADTPHTSVVLHVVPFPSDPAEQTLLVSLQGIVNRDAARLWIQAPGLHGILLDELRTEGHPVRHLPSVWDALAQYKSHVQGVVLTNPDLPASINAATSLAGILDSIIAPPSLTNRLAMLDFKIRENATLWTDSKVFETHGQTFSRGGVVHQSPQKTYHLRDWAIARRWFTFYEPDPNQAQEWISTMGPIPMVFGWGEDEHTHVRRASRAGGVVIPSDWCWNLSAYPHLPSKTPVTRPDLKHRSDLGPLQPGERVAAFIVSDGDNIQWLMNRFAQSSGFWASPHRGKIPVSWEFAPVLAEIAPRVQSYFYRTATPLDDFIAGPSGHGYHFPHFNPARIQVADETARRMQDSGLDLISLINSGGDPQETQPLLAHNGIRGILYKDYSPYNKRRGELRWIEGKPCLAYRFLLWDGLPEADPTSVARLLNDLPMDDSINGAAIALINVHAWSFQRTGGPMSAIAETVAKLSPDVQVVTASELIQRLARTAP